MTLKTHRDWRCQVGAMSKRIPCGLRTKWWSPTSRSITVPWRTLPSARNHVILPRTDTAMDLWSRAQRIAWKFALLQRRINLPIRATVFPYRPVSSFFLILSVYLNKQPIWSNNNERSMHKKILNKWHFTIFFLAFKDFFGSVSNKTILNKELRSLLPNKGEC